MSLSTLETAILAELWTVTGLVNLKKKHIMEWATTKVEPQDDEKYAYLPGLRIHVCYVIPTNERSR